MEQNVNFPIAGLTDITIRLGWAQLEIYSDDVEQIQVIVSGDAHTVDSLHAAVKDGELFIEQPQYGLGTSLDITRGHWLELCVRVPKAWDQTIHANTISGLIVARGLGGSVIELETISGDLKAQKMTAGKLALKTTAGKIRGEQLLSDWLTVRTVGSEVTLTDVSARSYRMTTVSGNMELRAQSSFELMDLRTVSGDYKVYTQVDAVRISMRTVSGRKTIEDVEQSEREGLPAVRLTGVSGNLHMVGTKKA